MTEGWTLPLQVSRGTVEYGRTRNETPESISFVALSETFLRVQGT